MNCKLLTGVAVATLLSLSAAAQAQNGVAAGATTGAVTGAIVGGPVGAAVGAGAGAIAGGIADETRPRFRSYVTERRGAPYCSQRGNRGGGRPPSRGVGPYLITRGKSGDKKCLHPGHHP